MPVFTPVVTVEATPAVSVTTTTQPTYDQIRNTLGSQVFNCYRIYINAPGNIQQLNNKMLFSRFDSDGSKGYRELVTNIAPTQIQATTFYEVTPPAMIDGRNCFQFNLNPYVTAQLIFYTTHTSAAATEDDSGKLALGPNLFQQIETATGAFGFFDNFKSKL